MPKKLKAQGSGNVNKGSSKKNVVSMHAKITPDIANFILKHSPTCSTREMSAKVFQAFNVKISHASIGNFMRDRRTERTIVTKSVVAEYLGKTVPRDLEILEEMREQLDLIRTSRLSHSELMQTIDRQRQVIDTRLKYAGAGETIGPGGVVGGTGRLEEWMKAECGPQSS